MAHNRRPAPTGAMLPAVRSAELEDPRLFMKAVPFLVFVHGRENPGQFC